MHLQFTAVKNKNMQYYAWFSTSLRKPPLYNSNNNRENEIQRNLPNSRIFHFYFTITNATKISTGFLLDNRNNAGTKANTKNTMHIFKFATKIKDKIQI